MNLQENLNEKISQWFEDYKYPKSPEGLYKPIEYTLRSGGKRIRPTLLLAAVNAFNGDLNEAKNQCLGIEMFHNFTLLHDDVMDNSDVRRGRPTVHRRWNANTAILSGDTMLTLATQLIADCCDKHLREVLNVFNETAIKVYEGQQMDMDFENRSDVSIEEYLEMIKLKTSVLLGGALQIGAILANADMEEQKALYNYGVNLGIGFQLMDDYLDTFGDPLIFGKQLGGDILNDKKTWLMITAWNEDNTGTMQQIRTGKFSETVKIEKVTSVYTGLELDKRILKLIKSYSEEAIKVIENLKINPESKKYFINLAKEMARRTH